MVAVKADTDADADIGLVNLRRLHGDCLPEAQVEAEVMAEAEAEIEVMEVVPEGDLHRFSFSCMQINSAAKRESVSALHSNSL